MDLDFARWPFTASASRLLNVLQSDCALESLGSGDLPRPLSLIEYECVNPNLLRIEAAGAGRSVVTDFARFILVCPFKVDSSSSFGADSAESSASVSVKGRFGSYR